MKYLNGVMSTAQNCLDAITLHQFYLNGHIAKLEDFLNPDKLEILSSEADFFMNTYPSNDFWLSGTGSAYGGGTVGLSDRYVAGFLWLEKLGMAAKKNFKVIVRVSFYKGHYGLLAND